MGDYPTLVFNISILSFLLCGWSNYKWEVKNRKVCKCLYLHCHSSLWHCDIYDIVHMACRIFQKHLVLKLLLSALVITHLFKKYYLHLKHNVLLDMALWNSARSTLCHFVMFLVILVNIQQTVSIACALQGENLTKEQVKLKFQFIILTISKESKRVLVFTLCIQTQAGVCICF